MTIRTVEEVDYSWISKMDWSPLTRPPSALFAYFVTDQQHVCLVAETEDHRPMGCLLAYRSSDGTRVHLSAMKVSEKLQRQGIGTALVNALKLVCNRIGVKEIWLFTDDSVAPFYERLDFVDTEMGIFTEAMTPGLRCMSCQVSQGEFFEWDK